MKTKIGLGIVCTALAFASGAQAQPRGELQKQAYNSGWSSADSYCKSLAGGAGYGAPSYMAPTAPPPITPRFKEWCKKGFDDFINYNQACNQQIRNENRYSEMWDSRRSSCE